MVKDVFVGTLATLSTIMSPLGPSGPAEFMAYTYDLKPSQEFQRSCALPPDSKHLKAITIAATKNELNLRLEKGSETYFTVTLQANLCTANGAPQDTTVRLNLPVEILDEEFLNRLIVDQSYVVPGLPSALQPNRKTRVALKKLRIEADLQPLRVEWIPENGILPDSAPVTIWIGRSKKAFSDVRGYTAGALPWRRIQFDYKHPLLTRTIPIDAKLIRMAKDTSTP